MENEQDEEDDEDLSENSFYQTQLQTVQLRNKLVNQQHSGSRAPTMTIDVVRVGRPLKILALLLSFISCLLFIVGSVSTSWIHIKFKSIGLFQQCDDHLLKQSNHVQLSMNTNSNNNNNGLNEFERICQFRNFLNIKIMMIIILDLIGLMLTILGITFLLSGIFSLNLKRKKTFYRASIILQIFSCIAMLSTLILLVIECLSEANENSLTETQSSMITVGWSLIIVCCGIVILGIAICLILFDKGGEEIEYRETIHRSSNFIEES
ncbi:unnamed protein product [Schistosoma turkestanicum]|nr:unnamed protein product [Schistosoma turkestanicum]